MDYVSELSTSLKKQFGWNKARVQCIATMIIALIKVRTVNLSEMAIAFISNAKTSSNYIRLKRFFRFFSFDHDQLALFIFKLFCVSGKKYYLTLDRTQWEFGRKPINILMLGLVYQGIAIPLYWELLDKRGCVNHHEKTNLFECFIKLFGSSVIAGILMDREFANRQWLAYLQEKGIPFYVRINKSFIIKNKDQTKNAWQWFFDLKPTEQRLLGKSELLEQSLQVAGMKLKNKDLLIIATSEEVNSALDIYRYRWEIETLFSCLKTRGFRFEETHMTQPDRIKKLISILALTFCWAHKMGEWVHQIQPITIKKHGYKAMSFFRCGLDCIRKLLLKNSLNKKTFIQCVKIFFKAEHCRTGDFFLCKINFVP